MTVEPELPDELLNEAREYTDTAVITIAVFRRRMGQKM